MEKKRRARINNCLNELKDLLMDAMDKDVSVIYTSICNSSFVVVEVVNFIVRIHRIFLKS